MQSLSLTLLLLVALTLGAEADRRTKNHKGGPRGQARPPPGCSAAETHFGKCVPEHGDCGDGLRVAACREQTQQLPCRLPCNWKKGLSDCKYRFSPWSSCDVDSNTKSRSGTLKRALFNAECQSSVTVSKACGPRGRGKSPGEKKSN